jgi:hypothetical protein
VFPASLERVSGFSSCHALKVIVFPADSNLKKISRFTKLWSITSLDVPRSIEMVDDFSEGSSRTAINMPAQGSLVQHWAFMAAGE